MVVDSATLAVEAAGVESAGLVAAGVEAAGVEAAGLDAAGVEAAELDAAGVVAACVDSDDTAGVMAAASELVVEGVVVDDSSYVAGVANGSEYP